MKHAAVAMAVLAAVAMSAQADVILETVELGPDLSVVVIDSEIAELGGALTNDVMLATDTNWLSTVLYAKLTTGTFLQTAPPFGGDKANAPFWGFDPTGQAPYDTVMVAGDINRDPGSWTAIPGAGDLGIPPTEPQGMTDTVLNITAGNGPPSILQVGSVQLARITATPDAEGEWQLLYITSDPVGGVSAEARIVTGGAIVNGRIIPEPATMVLIGLGLLGAARRPRRA